MEDEGTCHATLTPTGREKMRKRSQGEHVDLKPAHDYRIEASGGHDWLALPGTPATTFYRHEWDLQRHTRPQDPMFFGTPLPRRGDGEKQIALLVIAYLHPYTAGAE